MLTEETVEQIFTTYDVYDRDPEAIEQNMRTVILEMGRLRGRYMSREPEPGDAMFASFASCLLPMAPKDESYTRFMKERRREWFPPGLGSWRRRLRARRFFTLPLYVLDVTDLERILARSDAVESVRPFLGSLGFGRSGPLLRS